MIRHAVVSSCGQYRYSLERHWTAAEPAVFVMLNPSTADGTHDDPTIRRCIGFARSWGFGGLRVLNLFAYRSTNPRNLVLVEDPVGPANDAYLREAARGGELICAWGAYPAPERVEFLRSLGARLSAISLTKAGSPAHPLYLHAASKLVEFHGHA